MTPRKIVTVALVLLLTSFAVTISGVAQDPQYPPTRIPVGTVSGLQPYDPSQQQDIQAAQVAPDDPNTPDPALGNFAPAAHFQYSDVLPQDPASNTQLQSDGNYQQPAAVVDDNTPDTQADQPPPDLFDYDQPFAPGPYFLWAPGYWAHNRLGFFWVPGTWTHAPFMGALWTPPYWGFTGEVYRFHPGYWGTHIGYYGGVNYGFGYVGTGFYGGYWRGNEYFYNAAVTRVPATIATVYRHTPIVHGVTYGAGTTVRTSYNGGPGGLQTRPLRSETAAAHESHMPETRSQIIIRSISSHSADAAFSQNQGHPARAAMVPNPALRTTGTTSTFGTSRGPVPVRALPPASIQDAQQIEVRRQESVERMRQQMDARRAAGEPVTGITSGSSATTGSGLPYTRAIPSGKTSTTSTSTTSTGYTTTRHSSTGPSTRTTPCYDSPTTSCGPRPPTNSTSTVRREPESTPTESHPATLRVEPLRPDQLRPEPARTKPATVEPPTQTAPVEPIAHTSEPVHAPEPQHPANQPAHPAEPHPAPPPSAPPPSPRAASH